MRTPSTSLLSLAIASTLVACTTPEPSSNKPAKQPMVVKTPEATKSTENTIKTEQGPLSIYPLHHGTFYMRWKEKFIYIDPVTKALDVAAKTQRLALPKADLVLITDIHGDHLDPAAVQRVSGTQTTIITAKAVAQKAGDALKATQLMDNGQSTKALNDAITIEAVPMYNLKRTAPNGQLFHPKGRGNGYILSMGKTRVYISGDTACTPEMKALKAIDVAFVTMNLPYTMPVEEAAACIRAFKPKHLFPFHYRGQQPEKLLTLLKGVPTTVHLLQWYPQ